MINFKRSAKYSFFTAVIILSVLCINGLVLAGNTNPVQASNELQNIVSGINVPSNLVSSLPETGTILAVDGVGLTLAGAVLILRRSRRALWEEEIKETAQLRLRRL